MYLRFWGVSAFYVKDKVVKIADYRTKFESAIIVIMHATTSFRKTDYRSARFIFRETE